MATMRSSVTLMNADKVQRELEKFLRDGKMKAVPIVRTAAEILCAEAKRRAPVSKSGLKRGKWAHPPGTLRNSIAVGEVWVTKKGVSGAVGIQRNKYFTQAPQNMWYARWVEFGTKERFVKNWYGHKGLRHTSGVMPAQPFMRPALRKSRTRIRNTVRYRLQEELFRNA
ncbi:MAG: HK97 gp10 family phage protein [Bacillota bacterium]|jgi:HK97 gp10 family phage protein|nr:HK97 gp10 family phage protein [Bacillota bacterium]